MDLIKIPFDILDFMGFIAVCAATLCVIGGIIGIALEVKLDWTKNKELLLWYWDYDKKGKRSRKFSIIYKTK